MAGVKVLRRISQGALGVFFGSAGVFHFLQPESFVRIVPPYLPWPLGLVYISGVAELAIGLGFLAAFWKRALERPAAWGAIALLVAVYPANVNMWWNDVWLNGQPSEPWFHAVRLPLQLVFILWAWWHTRPEGRAAESVPSAGSAGLQEGAEEA